MGNSDAKLLFKKEKKQKSKPLPKMENLEVNNLFYLKKIKKISVRNPSKNIFIGPY